MLGQVASASIALTVVLLAGVGLYLQSTAEDDHHRMVLAVGGAGSAKAGPDQSEREKRNQRLVLGTWEDNYQGHRTLTIREDGTATMTVQLSGWKARAFTPRLRLDLTWSIENDHLVRHTLGGQPADKVQFVIKRVGDVARDRILELTPDRMLLVDKDGQTRYDWRRVESN